MRKPMRTPDESTRPKLLTPAAAGRYLGPQVGLRRCRQLVHYRRLLAAADEQHSLQAAVVFLQTARHWLAAARGRPGLGVLTRTGSSRVQGLLLQAPAGPRSAGCVTRPIHTTADAPTCTTDRRSCAVKQYVMNIISRGCPKTRLDISPSQPGEFFQRAHTSQGMRRL